MTDKYIGTTIGIYTIIEKTAKKTKDGHALYRCKCGVCGAETITRINEIHQHHDICRHNIKHWTIGRIGQIYNAMVRRCYDAAHKDYRWYGEKGIKICNEWLSTPKSFEEWALNNGYADNLTIDRIDSNKDYCPENCQWISTEENSRKAGKVNWITIDGKTLTGKQWSRELGVGVNRINRIIRQKGMKETIKFISEKLNNLN